MHTQPQLTEEVTGQSSEGYPAKPPSRQRLLPGCTLILPRRLTRPFLGGRVGARGVIVRGTFEGTLSCDRRLNEDNLVHAKANHQCKRHRHRGHRPRANHLRAQNHNNREQHKTLYDCAPPAVLLLFRGAFKGDERRSPRCTSHKFTKWRNKNGKSQEEVDVRMPLDPRIGTLNITRGE